MCLLSNNVHDYHFVSQGKTTIPNVDDGEEFRITDVSFNLTLDRKDNFFFFFNFYIISNAYVSRCFIIIKL